MPVNFVLTHPPLWTIFIGFMVTVLQWRNDEVRNLCVIHLLVNAGAVWIAASDIFATDDLYHQQVAGHWLMITTQISKVMLVMMLLCFNANYLNMTSLQVLILYIVLSILEIVNFADHFVFVVIPNNQFVSAIYPGLAFSLEGLIFVALVWPYIRNKLGYGSNKKEPHHRDDWHNGPF